MSRLGTYLRAESGSVSVEWAIVAAAVVSIGFGAAAAVNGGLMSLVPSQQSSGNNGGDTGGGGGDGVVDCIPPSYTMTYLTGDRMDAGRTVAQTNSNMSDAQLLAQYMNIYSQIQNIAYNTNANVDLSPWYDIAYLLWQELEARGTSLTMQEHAFLRLVSQTEPERLSGGGDGCDEDGMINYGGDMVVADDRGQISGSMDAQVDQPPEMSMVVTPRDISPRTLEAEAPAPDERALAVESVPESDAGNGGLVFSPDELTAIENEYSGLNRGQFSRAFDDVVQAYAIGQDRQDRAVMAASIDRLYVMINVAERMGYPIDDIKKTYDEAVEYYDFMFG